MAEDHQAIRPQPITPGRSQLSEEHDEYFQRHTEDEKASVEKEAIEIEEDDANGDNPEDVSEEVRLKVMSAPVAPSRQEALEHACTHIPFRS